MIDGWEQRRENKTIVQFRGPLAWNSRMFKINGANGNKKVISMSEKWKEALSSNRSWIHHPAGNIPFLSPRPSLRCPCVSSAAAAEG